MSDSMPVELLIRELDALPVSDGARAQFMALLQRFAGSNVHLKRAALTRPGRVNIAMLLLDQKMPIAQCVNAMMQRTGVSRATAYRVVSAALALRFERVNKIARRHHHD